MITVSWTIWIVWAPRTISRRNKIFSAHESKRLVSSRSTSPSKISTSSKRSPRTAAGMQRLPSSFGIIYTLLIFQVVWCWGPTVRKKKMDPLFWGCNRDYFLRGHERIRPSTPRGRNNGKLWLTSWLMRIPTVHQRAWIALTSACTISVSNGVVCELINKVTSNSHQHDEVTTF